jgi:arylsulfatase A-like enzyme
MNVILVLIDSLNRSHLSAYNSQAEVRTPNLDAFARRSWRMDGHFVGSLPCMPARREIFSGFKELMWRPWGPLEPFDQRLPRVLERAGYTTGIVTDHYHYWEESANGYLQSFQSSKLVRGHELDNWKPPVPDSEELPAWVQRIEEWRPGFGRRYYSNVREFDGEEDFFPAKVMTHASEWLKERGDSVPFFLQVESFDVHEPFHVPEPYSSMYGDGDGSDKFTVWPPYQHPDELTQFMDSTTPEELEFVRSQYAGKVAMVDRWLGELMATLDELELWDDTAVLITTDHGHDLGERRAFGKEFPHHDSHANIPLFVWHPRYPGNGGSKGALTQTVDLFGTILEIAGVGVPEPVHSRSFLPVIAGESDSHRDALLYGTFGRGVCLTDGEWTLIKAPASEGPLYYYSSQVFQSLIAEEMQEPVGQGRFMPGVTMPQWKVPIRLRQKGGTDALYDRRQDPGQERNLWEVEVDQRERMLDYLVEVIDREGAPVEQFERLGLTGRAEAR